MSEVGFYPSRRIIKRGNEYFAYLNLWPLVGVVVVLLVIFMVVTGPPFSGHGGVYPDRPVARHAVLLPKAIREDSIKVAVTRDGSLYFRNTRITPEDLPNQIREAVRSGSERRVYLLVDARSLYRHVKTALDGVREAGIQNVSFIVRAKWNN